MASPSSRAFLTSSSANLETSGIASAPELTSIEAGKSDTSTLVALNIARIEGEGLVGRYSWFWNEDVNDVTDFASVGDMKSDAGSSTAIAPDRDGVLTGIKNGVFCGCIEVEERALDIEPPRVLLADFGSGEFDEFAFVIAGDVALEPTNILKTEVERPFSLGFTMSGCDAPAELVRSDFALATPLFPDVKLKASSFSSVSAF